MTPSRVPDAFLSSGDDLAWAEPRAVWVSRRVPAAGGGEDWLVLEIDPPAPGSVPPAAVVVAAPRHPDERLEGRAPVHVRVLVPHEPGAIDESPLRAEQFEHAASGALYATAREATARFESLRDAGLARSVNVLEQALLAARRRSDVAALLPVLADADVFLPAPAVDSEVHEVPLAVIDVGGRPFVPVFSSLEALARYRPEGGAYVQLSGRALAEAVPGDYAVVLDPGSELAVPLEPGDLASLGAVPPADDDAELLIGEPSEEPVAALEATRRFAAGRPEVRAAYRALLVLRPGSEAEPVIGLELDPGSDGEGVIRAAAEAARAAGVESLAFVLLDDAAEGPVAGFLRDRTEAFYRRAC